MKIASTVRTLLFAASLVFPTYGIAETAADYNNRGLAKVRDWDLDGAIADYSRALELDPNLAAAYRRRGISHFSNRHSGEALKDFNHFLDLSKDEQDYPRLF